jgi:uncharacterized surface protein with fasciclin (FAS1) repeats
MKSFNSLVFAALLALPAGAAAQEAQGYAPAESAAAGDILETAKAAGSFTTLARAIEAAGLTETLKGEGPFTVFAPTDEAFAALPEGTLDALLQDQEKLTAILTYHVVPGKLASGDIARQSSAATVNGKQLSIAATDGQVKVGGATVTQSDVPASNGVIHVIDSVLLPE